MTYIDVSESERDILAMYARGRTAWEIADALGVGKLYVCKALGKVSLTAEDVRPRRVRKIQRRRRHMGRAKKRLTWRRCSMCSEIMASNLFPPKGCQCIPCRRAYRSRMHADQAAWDRKHPTSQRKCKGCHRTKLVNDFHPGKTKCKRCISEYERQKLRNWRKGLGEVKKCRWCRLVKHTGDFAKAAVVCRSCSKRQAAF